MPTAANEAESRRKYLAAGVMQIPDYCQRAICDESELTSEQEDDCNQIILEACEQFRAMKLAERKAESPWSMNTQTVGCIREYHRTDYRRMEWEAN